MKKFEEIIAIKIKEVLAKIIKPDIEVEKVSDLSEEEIDKIKERYGIEGIILDVDETIRKDMKKMPQCNEEWLEKLKKQLKIIVVSNGIDRDIERVLKEKGIGYIGFAHKPLKKGFMKACEKMGIQPEKILVIGDSLFDDIYGGKRNNMKTALVKQVKDEELTL